MHIASLVNCRPNQGSRRSAEGEINLYIDLSSKIHDLLYKFNTSRLERILDIP